MDRNGCSISKKVTSVINLVTSVIKLYHRLVIKPFVSYEPKDITYVSANRAANICMSRDVTKLIVNRAGDPFNLTRHPKSVSGMLQALMLLTQCMTHT